MAFRFTEEPRVQWNPRHGWQKNSSRISFPGHHRAAETKERAYIKGNFFRFGTEADEEDEAEEEEVQTGEEVLEEAESNEEPLVVADEEDDDSDDDEDE